MQLPSSCSTGEPLFRRTLLSAAKHHVPQGNIPNHIPNLPDSTKRLIRRRDELRSTDPTHPHIRVLDQHITKDISDSNRQKWIHTVETCSHKQNPSRFWSLLRTLSGKRPPAAPNQPITFNNTTLTDDKDIATAFNKQFTSIVSHTSDPNARLVKRNLKKSRPLDKTASPFTTHAVSRAIRHGGNSRAVGPDGLTIHHLKHLGPHGIQHLTHLFNLSYNNADIPPIWKQAIVVPIPKPGKPASSGSGYRPISLLCPAVKILERLLLPEINTLPLSPIKTRLPPTTLHKHSTLTPYTHSGQGL